MPKTFYVGVKGVVFQNNKVLLLRCSKSERDTTYWDFPGGRIEDGESITDTLRRELLEEIPTIKDIEIQNLLGAYQLPHPLPNGQGLMLLFYRVHARIAEVHLSEEHNGFHWVSIDEIDMLAQEAYLSEAYKVLLWELFGSIEKLGRGMAQLPHVTEPSILGDQFAISREMK